MSDFFSEDFFAPLDPEFTHPERPTLHQLQEQQAPTPRAVRAPARVLFEIQNELWEFVLRMENADVLAGHEKRELEEDLEQVYRKLRGYLRSRQRG